MADLLLAEDADFLVTEDGDLFALESDAGTPATGTVTLRQDHPANAYYDIGDVPVFTATFVDLDGAAVDPDIVVFSFRLPDGSSTSWTFGADDEVDSSGVGVYLLTVPELTVNGVHWCRVDATEPYAAAERAIGVRSTKFSS